MMLARHAARSKRGTLPSLFLMTDESRAGDLEAALHGLPRGAGVIFRHYGVPDRAALALRLRRLARARGLVFLVAGDARLAARVRADGFHAPEALAQLIPAARRAMPGGLITAAAHGEQGLISANHYGADAALLSPVFPTQSHPGAPALGPVRFAALASRSALPVIAMGGIDAMTARRLTGMQIAGFAAIGALMG